MISCAHQCIPSRWIHTYLHATSFHSRSTILSLPKTQFFRIRRLCSSISDYHHRARRFFDFFGLRGYRRNSLERYVIKLLNCPVMTFWWLSRSRNELNTPTRTILASPLTVSSKNTSQYLRMLHDTSSWTETDLPRATDCGFSSKSNIEGCACSCSTR